MTPRFFIGKALVETIKLFNDVFGDVDMSHADKIMRAESLIAQQPQATLRTDSHFSDGLYARTIHIPAGTILTGKIHLRAHLNIISMGTILVKTDAGDVEITAPAVINSEPGTKRLGYALTDCVWTTIHASDAATAEAAEDELVVSTVQEYQIKKLGVACPS